MSDEIVEGEDDDNVSVSINTGYYDIDTSSLSFEEVKNLHEEITRKGLYFKRVCIAMKDEAFEEMKGKEDE